MYMNSGNGVKLRMILKVMYAVYAIALRIASVLV